MNREDYILFIDGGLSDGVGFFIGNTFITAGHVINDNIIHTINVKDKILRKGDSGSPVMKGNFVYGVLVGGKPGTPKCVFLSAERIMKIIENKK